MASAALNALEAADDGLYYPDPSAYGVDEVTRAEDKPLEVDEATLVDPLKHSAVLRRLRDAFFAKYPFKSGTDGVDDYKTFKAITLELLALERHLDQGGSAQSFAASPSAIAHSVAWALRTRLAAVADAL